MSEAHGPEITTVTWRADDSLWRIHRSDREALWFGPAEGELPRNRFDAPAGEYRICYFGGSPAAAFVETLLRGMKRRVIARETLRARLLTEVSPGRSLTLGRLDGPSMVLLGTGGHTIHGADYAASRRLALEVFRHDTAIDGLRYRSRWDDSCFCIALFDRASSAVTVAPEGERLDRSPQIRTLLDHYRAGII